ncbi:TRAP transporter, DctM subunit [Limimonas halophila]|uniref:TRAP transporter, DctM subunit n=1 Tax=Limimonas halophila TaxID=1082479 RepID=A0A1G7TWV2_9PROT|nr:TRAP transporter large permease subunit [Limimonas halophila]SDG38990.1 TRAP transporter, DctM subunit [Limimonas halophila]
MSHEMIALTMLGGMLVLLFTGQRVFGAIGFVAAASAVALYGTGGNQMPFNAAMTVLDWYPLVTLPMFIYMGYMLSESGISGDLYKMFHVWAGPLSGGLAMGTIGVMLAISAMNGLSVAGMAIGASIALPEMMRRGYNKLMITGTIQAGSSLGILVPPSVVLVLYGIIAKQPIGQLWLAGIIPGLILAGLFVLYIGIRCWLQPGMGPPLPLAERQEYSFADKLRLLRAGIIPLVIFFTMMGLFFTGVTSLVESSAVGAAAATIVAAVKGRLTWSVTENTIRNTLSISCMFLWVIMAALCFGAVFDGIGAKYAIQSLFLEGWGLGPWETLIMMQLSFIVLGMFLDDTAMLVIVAPLYVPLVMRLGFDPVWYGVLYTITCQIAYMTPPFGYNLFLMKAMAPDDVGLRDIYLSIIPFVFIMVIGLAIIMAFPQLSLWLPELVYGD